jgi:16S rRNA (uracil1498-N3)-methyltransferase
MRLHRFYTTEHLAGQDSVALRDEAALHQLRDVFRLAKGDRVIFFDGDGYDYIYEAEIIAKKEASFSFVEKKPNFIPTKNMTLYMSLIKKDNFELVLEKATELGVTHFVPVITERTQGKNLNMERAEKIMKEASEQCGRGDVPTIGEITNLELVITNYGEELIVLDMSGEPIRNSKLIIDNCAILIGPEGGWSDRELKMFKDLNIQTLKLGDTVLRAETAAIVSCAKIILG